MRELISATQACWISAAINALPGFADPLPGVPVLRTVEAAPASQ